MPDHSSNNGDHSFSNGAPNGDLATALEAVREGDRDYVVQGTELDDAEDDDD